MPNCFTSNIHFKINKSALRFLPVSFAFHKSLPVHSWLLALVCAVGAAFVMPRQSAFPYAFQVGQPWNYRALKAPFNFEVLYPEEQVRAGVERVNAEHGPYFWLDTEVARQQKRQFARLLDDQITLGRHDAQYDDLRANAGIYLNFGQQMLDLLYTQGIADPNEEAFQSTPGFVFVVVGNTERRLSVRDLQTVTSARNFLTDTLPYSPLRQPELVLTMLEKVLTPNLRYSDSLSLASRRKKLAVVMGTGIMVRQGETIAQRNELISNDIYLKLHSLQRRYADPKGWLVTLGYGLLAWLAFGVFCFWWTQTRENGYRSRRAHLLPVVLALLGIVAVGFGSRVAAAVPLLWPLWILPVLLRRAYGLATGLGVWGVVVFLTTISLDWSAGWLVVQGTGLAALLVLTRGEPGGPPYVDGLGSPSYSWRHRALAAGGVAALQTAAGLAAGWAGKIPDVLWTTDSIVFLFAAAAFSLLAFPLGEVIAQGLGARVDQLEGG